VKLRLSDVVPKVGLKAFLIFALQFPYFLAGLTLSLDIDISNRNMADLAIKREATSMRQSAEWGMGTVQASFPRLKDTFTYEEYGERKITLTCLFLLYNCRARLVGINQIKNVYLPYLEADANLQFVPTNN
jgi:hypothetical protein